MKTETKFNVGDEIFFYSKGNVTSAKVNSIYIEIFNEATLIKYKYSEGCESKLISFEYQIDESEVFSSKEEFIKFITK